MGFYLYPMPPGRRNQTVFTCSCTADKFYYPPEWTPNQGSLNKFHGQDALRERARKIDQGILIIIRHVQEKLSESNSFFADSFEDS